MLLEQYIQVGYTGSSNGFRWSISELRPSLSPDGNETEIRHISVPGCIRLQGRLAYDQVQLFQEQKNRPWYQTPRIREWARIGVLITAISIVLVVGYSLIVPWISEKLAATVSVETEQQLGDGVYEALSADFKVDTTRTRLVSDFFSSMRVSSAYSIRIVVVNSADLNAFALPGGRIVVYSALLDKMQGAPELAALLAHEFTHVDRKHATRSIFRQLGSQVFLGLLFGKVGSVTGVLVDHADELRSLTYSRSLEKEADLKGLKLLMDRGIDPSGFQGLFTRLKSEDGSELPEFMASHPDLDNRIAYIKDSSKGARVTPQPQLDTIFAQLKK